MTGRGDGSLLATDRAGLGQLETLSLAAGEWLLARRHVAGEWVGRIGHFDDDSVAICRWFGW
jgi:hypothetical protein